MDSKTYYPSVISFRLTQPAKKRIREICKSEGLTYSQLFRRITNELLFNSKITHNDSN